MDGSCLLLHRTPGADVFVALPPPHRNCATACKVWTGSTICAQNTATCKQRAVKICLEGYLKTFEANLEAQQRCMHWRSQI